MHEKLALEQSLRPLRGKEGGRGNWIPRNPVHWLTAVCWGIMMLMQQAQGGLEPNDKNVVGIRRCLKSGIACGNEKRSHAAAPWGISMSKGRQLWPWAGQAGGHGDSHSKGSQQQAARHEAEARGLTQEVFAAGMCQRWPCSDQEGSGKHSHSMGAHGCDHVTDLVSMREKRIHEGTDWGNDYFHPAQKAPSVDNYNAHPWGFTVATCCQRWPCAGQEGANGISHSKGSLQDDYGCKVMCAATDWVAGDGQLRTDWCKVTDSCSQPCYRFVPMLSNAGDLSRHLSMGASEAPVISSRCLAPLGPLT